MKKIITVIAVILLVAGFSYADSKIITAKEVKINPVQIIAGTETPIEINISTVFRDWTQVFFEDFESGAPGWASLDETDVPGVWHTDEFNAYGATGKSWWMGDPDIGPDGGYLDHWYQVLDTPVITLPDEPPLILTFYQYRAIEEPVGPFPDNFDGWDGFNIRISDDLGTTWEILTDCNPAYNCSSMYSFGFEHGECPSGIPGIPGWGGSTGGWIYTEITIPEDYARLDVMIRFAFASDPAYCTNNDPTLIGVFVDDMDVAGVFFNDGMDETGFTASSLVTVGGDLWHIYDDPTAPSPTHALGCFDDSTGTYNPNMENFFISPKIAYPSDVDVTWDMFVKTGLDEGTFPDCDFLYVEIRYLDIETSEWSSFNSISNPLQEPIPNYVFTGSIDTWTPFSEGWPGYSDITCLDGHADSIQFRVGLHSNADDPTTIGFRVDNFEVLSTLDVLTPTNLDAEHDLLTGFVDLNWDAPSGLGGEMQWDDGSFENAIHFSTGSGYMGADFPVGGACTILEFTVFSYTLFGSTTMGVFEKSGTTYSSTPIYTMDIITQPELPATYTVNWDVQDDFIIAFECSDSIDCALDETTVPSEHSYVLTGGAWATWQAVAAANQLPDGEWGIRCTTTYPTVPSPNSYNLYRSLTSGDYDDPIQTGIIDTFYTDDTVDPGNIYYYVVTAVYDEGESDYSNEDWVFVEIANAVELAYDDGTAEDSYCAGAALNYLAVRITPDDYPVRLIRLKYFVTDIVSMLILRVWDDDGTGGLPGTQFLDPVLTVPISDLIENDWSVITIPESYDIMINDGDFYIGWMEPANSSLIGVDTDGPAFNRSYQYTGGIWFDYTSGIPQNLMMRAVVETLHGVDDEHDISQFDCLLQNYPNPVKNTTTIKYNLIGNKYKEVEIQIFNIIGQMVDKIEGINGKATWYPEDLPNGIYFYKLVAGEKTFTKKMVLMR
ncbi:MAG: T9SS type A sorting domain-containing protein [Candidatus Cloacimonetes bacterium]|nr:T9SS type A sorting domain-containing protein [Candidatus Cloacimonadota bacterium]